MNAEEVVVIGAGGFARELINYLRALPRVTLVGIVDDYLRGDAPKDVNGVAFIGNFISAAEIYPRAKFVVAAGKPRHREETCERVLKAGRELFTFVHFSAIVAQDAELASGCIVAPFSIVNAGAKLDTGAVLNVFCSVGHDAHVGAYTVLSPYAAINGSGRTGRACFLGTRSTIYPRVRIGNRCEIDTHSYAKADVGDRMIVTVRGDYRVLKNRLEKP
jgi:sugar O-acyltransferase (sialic acid O-acetyltransferase NeuD family)